MSQIEAKVRQIKKSCSLYINAFSNLSEPNEANSYTEVKKFNIEMCSWGGRNVAGKNRGSRNPMQLQPTPTVDVRTVSA